MDRILVLPDIYAKDSGTTSLLTELYHMRHVTGQALVLALLEGAIGSAVSFSRSGQVSQSLPCPAAVRGDC